MKREYKYHRERLAMRELIWKLGEKIEVNKLESMLNEEMKRLKDWVDDIKERVANAAIKR